MDKLLMVAIDEIIGQQKYLIEKINEIEKIMRDLQNHVIQDK